MRSRSLFLGLIIIFSMLIIAQNAEAQCVVEGEVYQQTLVPVGGGWWCWWCPIQFEYQCWEAGNVLVLLEWQSSDGWIVVDSDVSSETGHFMLYNSGVYEGTFRVSVAGNQPSQDFDWLMGYPPEWIEYYFWF
ncbi:MAG: hypothetical protein H8E57_11355 [Candidatus Cloacimonetes bacterium]|nr:hypothetical protein [Candidatus Cloacimonadota bacterium]